MSANDAKKLADKLFPIIKDDDVAIIDIPPEQRRLHTETYDFSISTLVEYLRNGAVFIPEFQRKYVWNRGQASRLIESLIIQCPIPVIYLNQEKDEKLSVIDGNQRLTSIKLFIEDGFELQGLTAYPELEGNLFSSLDPRFRRHILNRTLRCITILKETHPQIKIDVFERINTGAVQLNPQEIRHGVYHGPLFTMIDEISEEKVWIDLVGMKNDTRMKNNELVLRAFALSYSEHPYRKPLKRFLNNFSADFKDVSTERVLEWKSQFLTALNNINKLFGKKAFRVLNPNLEPQVKNFNSALFDAVIVAFMTGDYNRNRIQNLSEPERIVFLTRFQQVLSDQRFEESITSGTSATQLVTHRINTMKNFIQECFQ